MKTNFLKVFTLTLAIVAASCSSDDNGPSVPNFEGTVLQGEIATDLNIPEGDYNLKGAVVVKSGATLTIEAGTTFTVTAADQAIGANYLIVEQGGKLIAEGTASAPIVFTAESASVGAWGGIILNGKSTLNVAGGTEIAEAGGLIYGGTIPADNSGILRYVRVEYAGAAITGGTAEYNAFSFFGVGSGTILENLQAYKGADDGFEFFGGTVNATNLAAFGCEDDSIDWDRGYTGTINNVWVKQPANGDFAFECSNLPGEFNRTPRANATVNNVTIVGSGNATKAAFNFKEGTAGTITNVVATNVGYGVDLRNQLDQFTDLTLKINNANITFITALTRNGIANSTVNIDSMVSVNANASGANVSPFNNGTWLRNL
ncbi:hypothetical protein [Flavobacterium sp.]|uniref:hypothetical protein n=1 Tax=Flavobacterium sp. TaxID=239 RepID=UPI003B9C1728